MERVEMKVLVAYRSKYGFTARCAGMLRVRIRGKVSLVDLKAEGFPDIAPFGIVLVGGSIYGGTIQREVLAFCSRWRGELLKRHVGLFFSCLYQGEHAQAQLEAVFPGWLLAHAFGRYHLGGELKIERLGLFDRFLVGHLIGQREDRSIVNEESIESLCETVNAIIDHKGIRDRADRIRL
jgi:menaquinone-dependent protoporphyrinogen oxidase